MSQTCGSTSYTRHLVHRAGAGVDVGAPELRGEQLVAAEDVERQVAVAVVVAVEEAPLLATMQRVVGGVEVEDQPRRRPRMGIEEEIDEQPLDRRRVVAEPWRIVGASSIPG